MNKIIKSFLFPKFDKKFLIRIGVILLLSFCLFRYLLIPMRINGYSMEPNYRDGSFNFCKTFLNGEYKRFDVVAIKLGGTRIMYLKRIVALEGDTVEFKDGVLFVNSEPIVEPYVKNPCNWDLPERKVEKGFVYVVGDNRSMPIELHTFGQVEIEKIAGRPLW